jgi:hypothetical protein
VGEWPIWKLTLSTLSLMVTQVNVLHKNNHVSLHDNEFDNLDRTFMIDGFGDSNVVNAMPTF